MSKSLFTEREFEIFKLVAIGKTNKEIGEELVITIHTVKAHIASILRKISGKNRLDIIFWALKNGEITVDKNKGVLEKF